MRETAKTQAKGSVIHERRADRTGYSKMQAELDDRRLRLMPELIEEVNAPAPSAT